MAKITNRNYTEIDRPYDSFLQRSEPVYNLDDITTTNEVPDNLQTKDIGDPSEKNGNVETMPVKDGGSFGDVWITNFIRSVNWKPKKIGFFIDGLTGKAEFSNVFISGNITALSGTIGGWTINATTLSTAGILLDGGNQKLVSTNYVSGVFGAGFHLDSDLLEVGNIACRGLIRTAVFQKDVISVLGGSFAVLDGDVVDADMSASD